MLGRYKNKAKNHVANGLNITQRVNQLIVFRYNTVPVNSKIPKRYLTQVLNEEIFSSHLKIFVYSTNLVIK
jgi:hypothetical protein